jgi:uncharacterized protein (TIGR02246 family)
MRLAAAIALLLCTPGIADAFGAQTQSPQEQVRSAIADMNKAAASLDADRFMTWYWNSPSLAITFDGQTMRGWQSILEQQRKWWSDKNSGVQFTEQRPPDIVMQGADVASSIQWMTIGSTAESVKPAQLVITSVWKKRAEGWRIVLAHESLVP